MIKKALAIALVFCLMSTILVSSGKETKKVGTLENVKEKVNDYNISEEEPNKVKEEIKSQGQHYPEGLDNALLMTMKNQEKTTQAIAVLKYVIQRQQEKRSVRERFYEIGDELEETAADTINAEYSINKRWGIVKFFFGGDKEAVMNINNAVAKNEGKILELKMLSTQLLEKDLKNLVDGEIESLEKEQERLRELAEKEESLRGLIR